MYTSECARFLSSLPSHPPPLTISRKSIKSMYTDAKSLSPVLLNHLFHGPVGFAWGMRYVAFATLGCFVVGNAMLHEPVKNVRAGRGHGPKSAHKAGSQDSVNEKADGSPARGAESVNTQPADGAATPTSRSDGTASPKSDAKNSSPTQQVAPAVEAPLWDLPFVLVMISALLWSLGATQPNFYMQVGDWSRAVSTPSPLPLVFQPPLSPISLSPLPYFVPHPKRPPLPHFFFEE